MSWFILSVKANQEQKIAEVLDKMDVEVFCPTVKETKVWSDRKKEVEVALFKSYLFVNLEEKYRGLVFGAPGVQKYLFYNGKPAMVKNEDIWTIKKWMSDESNDVEALSKMIPGSVIAVKEGVLKDHEGVVYWVNKSNVTLLLKEMAAVAQQVKLKEVI